MDNEIRGVMNDLLDAVERLTVMAEELNPGATEQLRNIRFFLERADRALNQDTPS